MIPVKNSTKPPQPAFKTLSGTAQLRLLLEAHNRRRSLQQIVDDINTAASEQVNREIFRTVARNMLGPDASPATVTELAQSTFHTLPTSGIKIISEPALKSFLAGSDLLSDAVKVALARYLRGAFTTFDPVTDRLTPADGRDPVPAYLATPQRYTNPNPEIARAYETLHQAVARAAVR